MSVTAERVVDRLRVVVHTDPGSLAEAAAVQAADVMREAVAANGVAHVMFATGNSQLAFTTALVRRPAGVPWGRVVMFHMDEYVGVGPDHPAGFSRWIRERIADRVPVGVTHYLDGLAEPGMECQRYSQLLRSHPLDLCCLGIGENGHLAFNDPPYARFDDPVDVKVVELDRACRLQQVGEGHFPDEAAVPRRAITVTIPALLDAATVLVVAPEQRKDLAVRNTLQGPVSTACPATALRTARNATLHLDPFSAGLLDWD